MRKKLPVTISISGPIGSCKTAIAKRIMKSLLKLGIDIPINDFCINDISNKEAKKILIENSRKINLKIEITNTK
jgi:uridine kinase